MDADTWEEDMTYASYGYFIEDMGMLIHWSSDRVLISMHEMYPPILGYFCPSGKKDFLKLIPKWNKKEKVWAVKHQSSGVWQKSTRILCAPTKHRYCNK